MELFTQTRRARLSDYDLDIPAKLVAQYPHPKRDRCKLMVVDRSRKQTTTHRFDDLLQFLNPGDVLVLNNTQVYPARLKAHKVGTDASLEMLLLRELDRDLWEVLVSPSRKVRVGNTLRLTKDITCEVVDSTSSGSRIIQFHSPHMPLHEYIDKHGISPLPPYINRETEPADKRNYQTVYASKRGAIAAPTAGLHFTTKLLKKIEQAGVELAYVTLHIGIGTFRPVRVEDITRHQMDGEYYGIDNLAADKINRAKKSGHRVLAVGTSATRAMETLALNDGTVIAGTGWTDKFIYPPYRFKTVDGLLTNFHQTKSTLMLLVAAFAGHDLIMDSYRQAIKEKYRFFSYGDAMLIL